MFKTRKENDMKRNQTKRLMDKKGGRVCYHGYQSFKTDEVDAEKAHSIGVALAQELWGNRFCTSP